VASTPRNDFSLLSNLFNDTEKVGRSFKQGIEGGVTLINQAELTAAVAERAGLTKADAGKAVEALVGTITEALTQGNEVRISGFGSFGVSKPDPYPHFTWKVENYRA
jgi:hypothetical protein